ncbi:hypothetical protein R1flu_002204 [Riccia fluitans]|uniref:Uncharacterized protein n=1 Tax=Riccia fluitans TaxID=41844 RepID=A0ABD1Y6G6_9MARC
MAVVGSSQPPPCGQSGPASRQAGGWSRRAERVGGADGRNGRPPAVALQTAAAVRRAGSKALDHPMDGRYPKTPIRAF